VSTSTFWPTAKPETLATLTFVAPELTGYTIVVGAPAAVPTAVIVACSEPTANGPPTA